MQIKNNNKAKIKLKIMNNHNLIINLIKFWIYKQIKIKSYNNNNN